MAISDRQPARPLAILSVTFANKAAREMLERVAALIGGSSDGGLVHLPLARRTHPAGRHRALGLKPNFTILDVEISSVLPQRLRLRVGDKHPRPAPSWRHPTLERPRVDAGVGHRATEEVEFANARALALYRKYQERLRRRTRPTSAIC